MPWTFFFGLKMATSGKDLQTTAVVNLEQKGGEALKKTLTDANELLVKMGQNNKAILPIAEELRQATGKVMAMMASNTTHTKEYGEELKKAKSIIAGIALSNKTIQILDPDEFERLKEMARLIKQIQRDTQREFDRVQQGSANRQIEQNLGLKFKGTKQEEDRRTAESKKFWNDQVEQERNAVEESSRLGKLFRDNQAKQRKEAAESRGQLREMEGYRARYSSGLNSGRAQENAQAGGIDDLLGLKFKGTKADQDRRTADSKVFWREQVRQEREATEETERYAKLRANAAKEAARAASQADKPQGDTAFERNLKGRVDLATGDGAASLLAVQAAIRANSALLTGFTNSIQYAIQFSTQLEASFRNVQAVIGATTPEMVGLEKVIKDVSMGTRFSALEVADAALALGQAGLSAKQIAESIQPVIMLANASGATVAQSVDLVTSIVGVFDKNSTDVADIANKVTSAANSSKVSVDKLALGFQYAGNTAAQMGISFEETTAAMAAMSNAGIKSGSTMGTGLRQFLTEVQKPSEDFLNVLKRLGLTISDLDFRSKGFIGVMKTLRESGFVASDAIQSFDVRGAAAFNALLARPEDLQAQYDGLTNSTAAMRANEVQMNSLSAQGSRLSNTLGAMASTGFEPVLRAVTDLVRTMSDGLGRIAEFSTLLQGLGIVLTGLAAGVVTAWIGPLVLGLGRVAGILLSVTAAAPPAAGALTTLATAGTAVSVSMGGVALAAGAVGVAIAAGLAAYTLYNSMVVSTGERIEQLQSQMDKTTGAAKEKEEAITSLTNRLDILQQREVQLNSDQAALTSQVNETNAIMIRWGFTIDAGTNNLEALRSKIKEVREELGRMRFNDLTQIATDAQKVFEERKRDAEAKGANFANTSRDAMRRSGGLSFAGEKEFLERFKGNPEQFKAMAEGLERLKRPGGLDEKNFAGNSEVLRQLNSFASDPKNNLNFMNRPGVRNYVSDLEAALSAQSSTRQAQAASMQADANKNRQLGTDTFNRNLSNAGIDLQALGTTRNLATQAAEELGDKKTDALALHAATRALTDVRKNQITAERDRALALAKTEDDRLQVNTWYTSAIEKAGEGLRSTTEGAKKKLANDTRASSDPEEMSKIKARVDGNRMKPGDMNRYKELVNKKYDNEFLAQTIGMPDGDEKKSYRDQANNAARQTIEKFEEAVTKAGEGAANKALQSQEASYRALIEAQMREAKSFRGRANSNTPLDEISGLMDQGLAKIAEAKATELGSISRQYSKGSIEYKNLTAAAEEKYSAAGMTFISSFSSLIEAATERTYGLSKAFKAFDTKIKQLANKVEEDLYKKGEAGRANDLQNSINTGPVSGRNRSDVDTYLTNRAREPIDLEFTRAEIAGNARQSADITAGVELLQEKMDYASARLAVLEQSKEKLLRGRDVSELSEQEFKEATPLFSELEKLTKIVTEGEGKIEGYTNKLQSLRNTANQLRGREAGLTPTPEIASDWDNLTASAEKTWRAYNAFVGTQSVFKTLENGMFSSLQGIGGQISTFFSSVTQGTATVGQAFRTMAGNIIKSMADVLAQALAMQAVKSILGAFAGVAAGGGITAAPVAFGSATGVAAASSTGLLTSGSAGAGASFSMLADGGPIVGGIPGKDSVPVAAMPGEFMIKKSAVDALGMDYMHHLNNTTANAASNVSTPAVGPALKSAMSGGGGLVNVWIVSPEQMGSAGPNDVVATISDDINRGGPIKKLIKSVQMGA